MRSQIFNSKKTILFLFTISTAFISCKDNSMTEEQLIAKAKAIHERVITLDTHCDINVKNFTDSINYTKDIKTQVTLPKMYKGGLDVAWFIVYTGQDSLTRDGYAKAYDNAISKFNAIHKLVEEIAPDQIELATTSSDVKRIQKTGKKVAMIGIENGYPIGLDINNVERFYALGGRYMSLAHNGHSQLSDSHTGEKDDVWLHGGLSDFGKLVIKEMNRLGMMIDISHPSKEAIKQMIELTKAPVIASHSAARVLSDESRNLDDEQLQWIKQNGGVIQTVALGEFVNKEKSKTRNEKLKPIRIEIADSMGLNWYDWDELELLDKETQTIFFNNRGKINEIANEKASTIPDFPPAVNVSDFVDHIDYMVNKIGIEHVGISSDFDGGGGIEGWNDASETFNVTLELVKRGYTEEQIEKLWSGNLLRVLDEVETVAKEIQAAE
jgi:membrane dipeptidase